MNRQQNRASVVAMTIAEVFLLLMFVVWLGSVIQTQGGMAPDIEIAMLREQLAESERQLLLLKNEHDQLKRTVEVLRIMLDSPTLTEDDLKKAFGEKIEAAKRGWPKCVVDNVLVDATVRDGSMTARFATRDQSVLTWFTGQGVRSTAAGDIDADNVALLLEATRRWNGSHKCRFDYRFAYAIAEDYQRARETFEGYYYPAGNRKFQ